MAVRRRILKGKTFRLANWNYNKQAIYFVSVNTMHRIRYLGEIKEKQVILSEIGKVAHDEWMKIPVIRPDMNIELDEFIIMPDHMHGIIIIGENQYNSPGGDAMHGVTTGKYKNSLGPQRKNLASIIRGYKSAVPTFAKKNRIPFKWQSRFHEHIVRNDLSLARIREYIKANPENYSKNKKHK
jgi:putative transposase